MNLSEFGNLDIQILSGVLAKQVAKWDETWGSAKWRRENQVNTETEFWKKQKGARDRAAVLGDLFREEQKRREATP